MFILFILSFFSDGVNHTSCCVHEGVEDKCQQFCAFDRETAEGFTFTIAYISCIDDLNDIRSCMHRGLCKCYDYTPNAGEH